MRDEDEILKGEIHSCGAVDSEYYYRMLEDPEKIAFYTAEFFKLNPYDIYKMDYQKQLKMYSWAKERQKPPPDKRGDLL